MTTLDVLLRSTHGFLLDYGLSRFRSTFRAYQKRRCHMSTALERSTGSDNYSISCHHMTMRFDTASPSVMKRDENSTCSAYKERKRHLGGGPQNCFPEPCNIFVSIVKRISTVERWQCLLREQALALAGTQHALLATPVMNSWWTSSISTTMAISTAADIMQSF